MAALTNTKHEYFAQELAKGKSQLQAYLDAGYNNNKGAESNAARLNRNEQVLRRVQELKERTAIKVEYTIQDLLREYEEARQIAIKNSQASAMVAATTGKGKALGLIIDKKQSDVFLSIDDVLGFIADED